MAEQPSTQLISRSERPDVWDCTICSAQHRGWDANNNPIHPEAKMSRTENLKPIGADYSLPWVRGWEYVIQEGTSLIQRMREERGWSRDDVYELTDCQLDPNTLGLIEGEYGIGYPFEVDHLVTLAVLFGCRPGELLDRIYEEKGRELLAEDD